jgi:SAM-dependent methyltransferase
MGAWFEPDMYGWEMESSSRHIMSRVFCLLKPRSVVDVGCGKGTFLSECERLGVSDVLGLDGEPVRAAFEPADSLFRAVDLTSPLSIGRTFDIAICLEVAEHLPGTTAPVLIDTLVNLAPIIVFSAAHPGQGGSGHLNEQWPVYWHEKFQERDYVALDLLRGPLCVHPDVEDFYRTNLFLYAHHEHAPGILAEAVSIGTSDPYIRAFSGSLAGSIECQTWRTGLTALRAKILRRLRRQDCSARDLQSDSRHPLP